MRGNVSRGKFQSHDLRNPSLKKSAAVTPMPQSAPSVATAGRGGSQGGGVHVSIYRDNIGLAFGHLQQEHVPAMQRLAAGAELVRISQRTLRAAHLVVRSEEHTSELQSRPH